MIFIGVDPGMSGAIAILADGYVTLFPVPIQDDVIDVNKIRSHLSYRSTSGIFAYIEMVWKPSKLVRIAGILEGILLSEFIPVYRVAPSTWRKEILGNKNATKEDAINYCMEHFSDVSLLRTNRSRIQDHNLAEALLIAEYAKRKHFVSD